MYYIVGLGNPGDKYKQTRHNVGRMSLEWLVSQGDWEKSKHANALYSRGELSGEAIEFLLPETFMNKSGDTVRYVVTKHNATPEQFIAVHDDIDLPFGEIKVSVGKGAGGNNGVDSIIEALKSKDFVRVRIGIAPTSFWTGKVKRPAGHQLSSFVLKPFTSGELKKLEDVYPQVKEVLTCIVTEGVTKAMNRFN